MPQLDISTYFSQAFWLLISFCLLWALLAIFVVPKIADIIEQRKRKINDYLQKAEALNNRAKASLEHYNNALTAAQNFAENKFEAENRQLTEKLQKIENKFETELSRNIAESELKLAKEKSETLQQIETLSQELALQIVQKLGFNKILLSDIRQITKEMHRD